jgi:hypothetical protein
MMSTLPEMIRLRCLFLRPLAWSLSSDDGPREAGGPRGPSKLEEARTSATNESKKSSLIRIVIHPFGDGSKLHLFQH